WLFNTLTRYKAIVSGGAGDGGVDVKIFNRDEQLIGIVQCKRYQPDRALPPAHLRELNTVKQQHQVQYAWLATTARFSEDTRREARRLNIHLLDGARLHRMQKEARARARTHGTRPA
nr:restriction endonuclease [Anaerolineae bacterium]